MSVIDLAKLIALLQNRVPPPGETGVQRISFAYGNAKLSNPDVTREMAEQAVCADYERQIAEINTRATSAEKERDELRALEGAAKAVVARVLREGRVEHHGHNPYPDSKENACDECRELNALRTALSDSKGQLSDNEQQWSDRYDASRVMEVRSAPVVDGEHHDTCRDYNCIGCVEVKP